MKPKSFEIIMEFTPQGTKTGVTYEMHQKGSLIRCKDCKNWEADEDERCMYCGEGILPVTEACMGYGFCSMAEPKETT